MNWMLMPYNRYFDFSGRSRRMEYWMFQLFVFIVYMVFMVLSMMLGGGMTADGEMSESSGIGVVLILALAVWGLATIIPSLALTVRRLHDTEHSGWWILIGFIPIIGGLVLLYFMLIEGTRGPNAYGPDPKEGVARGV